MEPWQTHFESELARAETARQDGNEGMARVCARRAAGAVVKEYMRRRGLDVKTSSAYEALQLLSSFDDLEPVVLEIASHLLARITPEHTLPVDADLPAEAGRLPSLLLGE